MIANRELISDMAANGCGSRESNDDLYLLVAAGDKTARVKMIEMNMPFVISKVEQYLSQFPEADYLHDDLVSAGFIGLTEAVNRMAESGPQESPNATGYMSYWIGKRIGELVDEETGLGSSRTQQYARKNNRRLPKQVDAVDAVDALILSVEVEDPTKLLELRDLIASCCETDADHAIVDLREKRYTDREISAQLGIPYTTTYMMRREIYRRFLEKSEYQGEV